MWQECVKSILNWIPRISSSHRNSESTDLEDDVRRGSLSDGTYPVTAFTRATRKTKATKGYERNDWLSRGTDASSLKSPPFDSSDK